MNSHSVAPAQRPTAFLVAASAATGANIARLDWGWRQVGPMQFLTPWGEYVEYAHSASQLADQPVGTRVFFTDQATQHSEFREIAALMGPCRFIVADPIAAPRADPK